MSSSRLFGSVVTPVIASSSTRLGAALPDTYHKLMNNRMKSSLAIFLCSVFLPGVANTGTHSPDPRLSGGATTVFDTSSNAFSLPARNLSLLRQEDFFTGRSFFKLPWVAAPASTTARDGLGPLFNQRSCMGCHARNGRSQPPLDKQESFATMLVRLGVPAATPAQQQLAAQYGAAPEPVYGDQLQPHALRGMQAEASPRFDYTTVRGQFRDGETYTLLKPGLVIDGLNYGALHPQAQTSARVAPALIGMGLLQAIPEPAILANADPDDDDGDGISGRPNRVWDLAVQQTRLGRFGWKATHPSIDQQNASAFSSDIGITTDLYPQQPCTAQQRECRQAAHGGKPEISRDILDKVNYHVSLLATPARRDVDDPTVIRGQKLFTQAGCAACHIPAFTTGELPGFPELSGQRIQPYTDLLLHDMGEGLADNRPDFAATGREWRTPPLWGIGLVPTVNGHSRFLHDGRARNLLEAILWHGGEAEHSRQQVLAMSKEERAALVRFLESL